MKLAAGVCFFEKSIPSITRCIESIKNHVDVILAIDGRFDKFPDQSLLSTPEVREYLSSIKNVVLVDYPASEIQKRQKYCELAKEYHCDWLIIIDSDEYMLESSDWKAFQNNILQIKDRTRNVYGIRFAYSAPVHMDTTPYPRLWYRPWEVTYIKHNLWHTQRQGDIKSSANCPIIEGITMTGNNNLVSPEYIQQGRQYQEWLIRHENPVEKTWQELFDEADILGKLDLFKQSGGSGKANTDDLIEEIVKSLNNFKPKK